MISAAARTIPSGTNTALGGPSTAMTKGRVNHPIRSCFICAVSWVSGWETTARRPASVTAAVIRYTFA